MTNWFWYIQVIYIGLKSLSFTKHWWNHWEKNPVRMWQNQKMMNVPSPPHQRHLHYQLTKPKITNLIPLKMGRNIPAVVSLHHPMGAHRWRLSLLTVRRSLKGWDQRGNMETPHRIQPHHMQPWWNLVTVSLHQVINKPRIKHQKKMLKMLIRLLLIL